MEIEPKIIIDDDIEASSTLCKLIQPDTYSNRDSALDSSKWRHKLRKDIENSIKKGKLKYKVYRAAHCDNTYKQGMTIEERPCMFEYSVDVQEFEDDTISNFIGINCAFSYKDKEGIDCRVWIPTRATYIEANRKIYFSINLSDFAAVMTNADYQKFVDIVNNYDIIPRMDVTVYTYNESAVDEIVKKSIRYMIECSYQEIKPEDLQKMPGFIKI